MAMAFKFDEAVGCYFVRWTGTITAEEYQSHFRVVHAKPWFRKGLNAIHDRRNAVIGFERADVLTKARTFDMIAPAYGDIKSAVLVSGAEDMRLMSAFVGASVKAQGSVDYFDNYNDARAWVELPEDYPDPFEDAW